MSTTQSWWETTSDRVASVLATAADRSDAVIITGGIGPTQDDLTREGICAAFGLEMDYSEEYALALKERWESFGRVMPESNYRQAQYPAGADLLTNPKGTAPGLAVPIGGKVLFALPGVPEEMIYLLEHEVLPRLLRAKGEDSVVFSRLLRSWGISEAKVGELLDDLYTGSVNPSIAFLASGGEIKVRITAKASTAQAAEELIKPVEASVRERLGSAVFAADEDTIDTVHRSSAASEGLDHWDRRVGHRRVGRCRFDLAPGSVEILSGLGRHLRHRPERASAGCGRERGSGERSDGDRNGGESP